MPLLPAISNESAPRPRRHCVHGNGHVLPAQYLINKHLKKVKSALRHFPCKQSAGVGAPLAGTEKLDTTASVGAYVLDISWEDGEGKSPF